jgi:hypothetical protein
MGILNQLASLAIAPVQDISAPVPKKPKPWPDNPLEIVAYEKLVSPLKAIIRDGYRLIRKEEAKSFEYNGYQIGKQEQKFCPPLNHRFTEKLIAYEDTKGTKLIDIVLNTLFLLGIEQGRRLERKARMPMDVLLKTLDNYREVNKNLRLKIDELEAVSELKQSKPDISDEELKLALVTVLNEKRAARIEKAKEELSLDPIKNKFTFKSPKKSSFKTLRKIEKSLPSCNKEQWKEILEERGWDFKEWEEQCKRKPVILAM